MRIEIEEMSLAALGPHVEERFLEAVADVAHALDNPYIGQTKMTAKITLEVTLVRRDSSGSVGIAVDVRRKLPKRPAETRFAFLRGGKICLDDMDSRQITLTDDAETTTTITLED